MDLAALERSARRFSVLYKLRNEPWLERAFSDAVTNLADVVRDESYVNASLPHNVMQSVNLPAFVTFLSLVEDLGRQLGLESIEIVHDESREFAVGFGWLLSKYARGRGDSEFRLSNDYLVDFTLEKVSDFKMVASHESAGVQAADILASAMNLYARDALKGEKPEAWIVQALEPILGSALFPAFVDAPPLARLSGSSRFYGEMFRHLPMLQRTSS